MYDFFRMPFVYWIPILVVLIWVCGYGVLLALDHSDVPGEPEGFVGRNFRGLVQVWFAIGLIVGVVSGEGIRRLFVSMQNQPQSVFFVYGLLWAAISSVLAWMVFWKDRSERTVIHYFLQTVLVMVILLVSSGVLLFVGSVVVV